MIPLTVTFEIFKRPKEEGLIWEQVAQMRVEFQYHIDRLDFEKKMVDKWPGPDYTIMSWDN